MATTVGQHSISSFATPVNGGPLDANVVRGNDNTIRTAYVAHDADTGIHVQSSTLAARPSAGTAGRKWITEDSGVYTLWFDDGTNWHPVSSENVALTVLATENLAKGDVVKVVGWNNGQDLPEVAKVASASDVAFAIITAAVTSGAMGYATNTGIVQDVNTNSFAAGTILYPNTSGGFTSTKPTSGNYQVVAYVLRQNTNNGVLYVEFSAPRIVERSDNTASTIVLRDSNGDFSAGTITATAVNATTLDLTNLEVTNIKAKDGTQAIAIADATGKLTISDGVLLSGLTASQAVFTDASKNLVSNAITGTGNVVMSASPTLTGTVTAATLNATTLGGTLSTAAQPNVTSVGTLTSLTVSGDLTVDTNTLKVDSANNRVGIGTVSPATSLDVATGNLQVRASGKVITDTIENYGTSLTLNAAGSLNMNFALNGSTAMSLLANGNFIVDTNTLYVDAANNRVGVGTASPGARFHSLATTEPARFAASNDTSLFTSYYVNTSTLVGYIGNGSGVVSGGGATNFGIRAESALIFAAGGNAERARITSGGALWVGTTTGVNIAGRTSRVNAVNDSAGEWVGGFVHSGSSSPFGLGVFYSATAPNGTGNPFLFCEDNTALRAEIRSNGGIANYSANNVALSDARIKTDITPVASMWDKVSALEIVTYKYVDQTHDDVNLGVIAQQVETVEPVWVDSDGFGETPEGDEPLKTVYTTDITFAAIKALQEAMARIEALEARLEALEA